MASYLDGGWYNNPATGQNQRWMNGGFLPVGQTDPGSSNSSDIPTSSQSSAAAIQPFGWNADQWNKAQQDAIAKLTPYYKQLLDLNNGDVNRAKTALENDYTSGVRFHTADYGNQMSQENVQEGYEMRQTLDSMNKRGLLFQETAPGQQPNAPKASGTEGTTPTVGVVSNYSGMQPTATQQTMDTGGVVGNPAGVTTPQSGMTYSSEATNNYLDPLLNKQQQRRNAIQNAVQKQTSTASNDYVQSIGDQNSLQTQYALQQGEKKSQQATQMANDQYQHESDVAKGANTGASQPYLNPQNPVA